MSQRHSNIREEIEPWLSELIRLYETTNPDGGEVTQEGKLENAHRAVDVWWYLYAKLMLWAQSHIIGKEFLDTNPDLVRRLNEEFATNINANSHLLEYVGLQFAFNPVDRYEPALEAVEHLLDGADYISPDALRKGIDELLMSKSADSSFWRFELQTALRSLSLGHTEDLLKPAPLKRQGNPVHVRQSKLLAIMHVYYLVGKGFKKYRAFDTVADGIGQSAETLRTWEKELLRDDDCADKLWYSSIAGDCENQLDNGSFRIVDESGREYLHRNTSLTAWAQSALARIRRNSFEDIRTQLNFARLGSGE